MGGIVSNNIQPISSFLPSSHSISASFPKYYNPEVTCADIELCSQIWIQILDETTPSPSVDYSSIRDWFYMKLYHLLQHDPEIPKFVDAHLFLRSILQLIPISFHQFENSSHFFHHFQHFGKRCSQVGITASYFNNFGSHLFSVISEINNQGNILTAWCKLYSSILSITLPYVCKKFGDITSQTSEAVDPSISLTLNSHSHPFLYVQVSSSGMESNQRFYTAMENIIL